MTQKRPYVPNFPRSNPELVRALLNNMLRDANAYPTRQVFCALHNLSYLAVAVWIKVPTIMKHNSGNLNKDKFMRFLQIINYPIPEGC